MMQSRTNFGSFGPRSGARRTKWPVLLRLSVLGSVKELAKKLRSGACSDKDTWPSGNLFGLSGS